jgi:hypothetical protein
MTRRQLVLLIRVRCRMIQRGGHDESKLVMTLELYEHIRVFIILLRFVLNSKH